LVARAGAREPQTSRTIPRCLAHGIDRLPAARPAPLVFGTLARLFFALSRLRGELDPLSDAGLEAEPTRPISGTQLRKLAKWLSLHQPRGGSLGDIHALDGYLTGIVVGPQAVMPGTWIDDLFPGAVPRDIDAYLQLIAQHMNGIAGQCSQRLPDCRPLLETHPQLSGQRDPMVAWCQGFVAATELRQAQWARLLRRKDAAAWLQPIRQCAEGDKNTAAPLDLHTLKTAVLNFCAQRAK